MADISNINPQLRDVEIIHPGTGLKLGISVTVCSIDDPLLTRVKRSITDERMRLEQKNKAMKAADIEENRIKILQTAIRGWNWYSPTGNDDDIPTYKGEVPEYIPANVRAILSEEKMRWFGDQINAEISETESFFAK